MTTQTQIPRYSKNAITSDRASGYKSTTHALAELVDNSFDWGAKHVKVFFIDQAFDNTAPQISEILVADDGIGMDDDTLFRCLIIGDGLNIEQGYLGKGRTGKFGYGLPKGSISQCKTTRVFSRQNGDKFKRNILEVEPPSNLANDIEEIEPPPYYTEIGAILSAEAGTIISWTDLDRLNAKRAETLMSRCESLFGKMHRYSLKEAKCELIHCRRESNGVVQILSKTTVRPNDPLFLMEDTVVEKYLQAGADGDDHEVAEHYAEFLKEGGGCLPTSEIFEEFPIHFEWKEKAYRFDITVSKAKVKIQKPGVREGGRKEVGKFYVTKGIENIQTPENISFVREHRELDSGRFRVKLKSPGAEQHRWWAIEVKFDADADELMGVENSKQGVAFSYSPGITHEEWQQQKFTASEIEARDALFSRLSKVLEEAASKVFDKIKEENKQWDSQDQDETQIPDRKSVV